MALFFPSKEMLLVLFFSISPIGFGFDNIYDYDIEIYNGSYHTSLVTTCTTSYMPLGTVTIKRRSPQIFQCGYLDGERSMLTCNVTMGKLHGGFTFFNSGRDHLTNCKDLMCSWIVDERGLSMRKGGREVLHYRWP